MLIHHLVFCARMVDLRSYTTCLLLSAVINKNEVTIVMWINKECMKLASSLKSAVGVRSKLRRCQSAAKV